MEHDVMEEFKQFTNEEIGSGIFSLIETTFELIPYMGNIIQVIKINRANRRIKKQGKDLIEIQKLMSITSLSKFYYEEIIGPVFIEDFLNEHEDAKIVYLLNGYRNVFIEENNNESIVYQHFDT